MSLDEPNDLASWKNYKSSRPSTKLIAGYLIVSLDNPDGINSSHTTEALQTLADEGAQFWCFFSKNSSTSSDGLQAFVDCVAARAEEFGLDLNIYPHDEASIFAIQSLEEAMCYIKQSKASNLKVSAHLSHEIRAGNGHRMEEVLRAAGDHLALVTINGADIEFVNDSLDWSGTIQPLGKGSFDVRNFVDALERVGYQGPVILHTFGLVDEPVRHYQDSYNLWQTWMQTPRPTLSIYPAPNDTTTVGFSGTLELSTDLKNWTQLSPQPTSPLTTSSNQDTQFFRTTTPPSSKSE